MDGKLPQQISPRAPLVGADDSKPGADSPMRRKLVNALMGGALLHTFSPVEALAMGIIPGTHDAIDTMYLEFLRKLLAVATHDDLADMPFIEKTLGVRFVFKRTFAPDTDKERKTISKTDSYWIEGLPVAITDTPFKNQTYSVTTPLPGNKAQVSFSLWLGKQESSGRGINPSLVQEVFGPPRRIAPNGEVPLYSHEYQWQGKKNYVGGGFNFRITDFALIRKTTKNDYAITFVLYQNSDRRIQPTIQPL